MPLRAGWLALQSKLGVKAKKTGAAQALSTSLSFDEANRRIQALPAELQQALTLAGLPELQHQPDPRTHAAFEHTYTEWQAGRPAVLILHSPPGGGKVVQTQTWLNSLEDEQIVEAIARTTVYDESGLTEFLAESLPDLQLEGATEGEQEAPKRSLLDQVLDQLDNKVLVLHRVHNLFLRSVGCYQALELLLSVIVSHPKTLWVLTMDTEAYRFIERLFSINEVATDVVALDALSEQQNAEWIQSRLASVGLQAEFVSGRWQASLSADNSDEQAADQDQTEQQQELGQRWYKGLQAASGGNPAASLFYAASTLRWDSVNEQLYAYSPERIVPALVVGARPTSQEMDRLLVLSGVLTQGEVALTELASTLGWDRRRAATSTFWLMRRGILIERHPGMLRVNPAFVRDVNRELRQQHLVY